MNEYEWKERERRAAVRALMQQEEQRQRDWCTWIVIWFAQQGKESHG